MSVQEKYEYLKLKESEIYLVIDNIRGELARIDELLVDGDSQKLDAAEVILNNLIESYLKI